MHGSLGSASSVASSGSAWNLCCGLPLVGERRLELWVSAGDLFERGLGIHIVPRFVLRDATLPGTVQGIEMRRQDSRLLVHQVQQGLPAQHGTAAHTHPNHVASTIDQRHPRFTGGRSSGGASTTGCRSRGVAARPVKELGTQIGQRVVGREQGCFRGPVTGRSSAVGQFDAQRCARRLGSHTQEWL